MSAEETKVRLSARFLPNAELAAIFLAFAVDLAATVSHLNYAGIWRIELSLAFALVGAVATLMLPSHSHQRWYPMAVALLALPAIGYFNPRVGLTGLVLVAVLEVRCTLAFGLRGSAIVALFATLMLTVGITQQMPAPAAIIALLVVIALFGAIFGFVAFLANILRSERIARRELEEAHRQLRTYAQGAAEAAMMEERSRVALDLHDALGHGLTTLSVQLQSVERLRGYDDEKAETFVKLANATSQSLLADLRETVGILRGGRASSQPFSTLVKDLFTDFARTDLFEFDWNVTVSREPDGAAGLMLLRVTQEALTNVARHAAARHLNASVDGSNDAIVIAIEDDGRGFSPANVHEGTGLNSMRERLASLGGSIRIDSTEGGGTTILAIMPLGSG